MRDPKSFKFVLLLVFANNCTDIFCCSVLNFALPGVAFSARALSITVLPDPVVPTHRIIAIQYSRSFKSNSIETAMAALSPCSWYKHGCVWDRKKGLNLRGFDRNICRFQKNPLFSILRLLSSHPLGISDLLNCDKTPSFRKLILWALQRFESNPVHRSKGGEQAVISQITFLSILSWGSQWTGYCI